MKLKVEHGKGEASEPRWVRLRLCWTPPHSPHFLTDNNMSEGLFPWLFLWDYVLVARNLVLSHNATCFLLFLVQFFPMYIHILSLTAFTEVVFLRES